MQFHTPSFACLSGQRCLHIVQQHGHRSTQRHVVYDLPGTNVLVVVALHKDGGVVVGLPGHFLGLRGQHPDALDVFLEGELLVQRKHGRQFVDGPGLGDDEGVELHGFLRDEHSDVPLAVVAQLVGSVGVPHLVTGPGCRVRWTLWIKN